MLVLAMASASAQTYPSHQITNGEITATVYLPDAKTAFYKTTRFDWSGAIGSLKYKRARLLRNLVVEDHRHLRLRLRRSQ